MNLTTSLPAGALAILAMAFSNRPSTSAVAPNPALEPVVQDEAVEMRPTVAYFRPENLDAMALSQSAQQLIYSGGVLGDVNVGGMYRAVNTQVLDQLLIVSATPDLMPGVLALLTELDQQAGKKGDESDDRKVVTFQYQLRFASYAAVSHALEPFNNFGPTQANSSFGPAPRITIVRETGTVVARATIATVAEIRRVLEEIDVPDPQIRLTYYLIEGLTSEMAEDEGLTANELNVGVPSTLVEDLGGMVPVEGFRILSFGVLQGDALAERQFSDEFGDAAMRLRMEPTTFDRQTGALGLDRVEFELMLPALGGPNNKGFTTSAQIEPGRYTVLGGVGAEPIFVVLHMTRM